MGQLVDGVWQEVENRITGGRYQRASTHFRNWVTADGSPGPSGEGGFAAAAGRYHLYVCFACPWAHRTLIFRALKKLDNVISVTAVSPLMGADGWVFDPADPDTVNGKAKLSEIYLLADPRHTGRVSVPVLWDKQRRTIVNNESSEIIRMLNTAFAAFTDDRADYYPTELRATIDDINALVYENINNGVYRAGFAVTQDAYAEAFGHVFAALDHVEQLLSQHRYLAGNRLTEADWRLFTTLVRFDAVYYSHFKCNLRRILDYPNLSNYVRDLYQVPRVAPTVDLAQIKTHYYSSHRKINPTGIVPLGPALDFNALHDRARFGGSFTTTH